MPLTASLVQVADTVYRKIEAASEPLGIADVFYGDQRRIPRQPTICIEPDDKTVELKGMPRRTRVQFTIFVIIYHDLVDSPQRNRREADELAEAIEDLLNSDPDLKDEDGNKQVIHCMVSTVSSGYVQRNKQLLRASRLTFTAESQAQLPNSS